ncbi:hypothetical protein [Peribacillus tepidiphilus]|jgi:hypothetical protein
MSWSVWIFIIASVILVASRMVPTMFLENQGFKVMNMTGGMSNWNWETV